MQRTKSQNAHLHKLLGDLRINTDTKESLVAQFSENRTIKSSELTVDECRNLIGSLEAQKRTDKEQTQSERKFNTIGQVERRKVFKIMYDIGFINNEDTGERKVYVINAWIKKKLNLDKGLNDLSVDELNKMIKQLHTVRRNYKEKENKEAKWN